MALQWQFPGGKIEPGESPEEALRRELREELGISARIGPRITHIRHYYRNGHGVDLQFFVLHEYTGDLENRVFNRFQWVRLEDLPKFDFLAANRNLVKQLAGGKIL
jgi:8-oxo-dGTP diphosphatase